MTDGWLMDALCTHGAPWDECEQCEWEQHVADDQATDDDWIWRAEKWQAGLAAWEAS